MRSTGNKRGTMVAPVRRKRADAAMRPGSAIDLPFADSVGYQVRATNRAFQMRLRERVEPYGVSPGMWYFLRLLWQEDGLMQRELGRRLGLMDPTAFTALSAMERRGLVKRVKDPRDGRKINVRLTARGRALREQMLPLAHDINAEGLRGFTPGEVAQLLRLLKRIEADLLAKARPRPR